MMRGRDVARLLGVPFYDVTDLPQGERFGTLVLVKYWPPNIASIRAACDRLILDPLDVWTQTKPDAKPVEFWRWVANQTGCDAMLATSPAAQETMREAGVETILAPHAADPRIGADWYDAHGHIVYAGGQRFLGSELPAIEKACRRLGRRFVARYDRECWQALQGAALSLCVRFGKERTPLNCWCKPAVKLANAAAAGIPVLSTNDPAVYTLADVPLVTGKWDDDIASALNSQAPFYPHSLDEYAAHIAEILL